MKRFAKFLNLKDYDLEHVGAVKSESTDAYEMLIPLGKDHVATLRVDADAIEHSGFFCDREAQTWEPYEPRFSFEELDAQVMGFLQGKVLTIIDASYQDVTQREAVKSLIKQTFRSQFNHMTGNAPMNSYIGHDPIKE